jgi:hypothetical protein
VVVHQAHGVDVEQLAIAASEAQAGAEVVGGVILGEGPEDEAPVDPRQHGSVPAEGESVEQLGQSDEEEREQRARVPLVIAEDVQMIEGLGVEEVSLVEEEDGVDALLAELLDVRVDGVEDGG